MALKEDPPKAHLDDILEPWTRGEGGPPSAADLAVQSAIREAYRLGHTHGRHGIIRNDEQTFIERLREKQNGQES